jgi:hypothetical protein
LLARFLLALSGGEEMPENIHFLAPSFAGVAQLVEHHHGKVRVVGSIPTSGSDVRIEI